MQTLNLKQLEAFCAVVERGSFTAADQQAAAAVGFRLLHGLGQRRAEHRVEVIPCLFGQALCQRRFRSRRGDKEDFVEGVLAHAGHSALVLLLLF